MFLNIIKCNLVLLSLVISAVLCDYEDAYDEIDFQIRVIPRKGDEDTLNLPSNATSIRENITDTFSCENRTYGYYADVDNECQIFHVCQQVTYADGKNETFRWSFICPNGTVFNQEVFTCVRPEDSIDCEDSPMYYNLNDDLGHSGNDSKKGDDDSNSDRDDSKLNEKPESFQNVNTLDDLTVDMGELEAKPSNFQVTATPNEPSNYKPNPPYKSSGNGIKSQNAGRTDENKIPVVADKDPGSWIIGPRSTVSQRRRQKELY